MQKMCSGTSSATKSLDLNDLNKYHQLTQHLEYSILC